MYILKEDNNERIKELESFIKDLYSTNRSIMLEVRKSPLQTEKQIKDSITGLESMLRNLKEIEEYKAEIEKLNKNK